jgi:type II secretory pathway pseudopilin PulG
MKTNRAVNGIRRLAAFTLTEVVISAAILTISAAGLLGGVRYAFFAMKMARENQRATQIVLERAEAIRCFKWDWITSGKVPSTFTEYYDPTVTNNPNSGYSAGTLYSGTVKIDTFPFTPSYSTNIRQLTVTVTWNTGSLSRSRTNVTFISYNGVQNYVY